MSVILIRHGKTQGNLEGRYIGSRTDEPLCPQGIAALKERAYPPAVRVYTSPLRRCLESAAIIYPGVEPVIVDGFRECDFGEFEGKNYAELNGRSDYQAWIDSGGDLPFPGGESRKAMCERCVKAFEALDLWNLPGDTAIIAHGGTIMALMSAFALPPMGYFDYQPQNGTGYVLRSDLSWRRIG